MIEEAESSHFAIVAVGPFAPLSMTPEWFRDLRLVGADAAAAAYKSEGFVLIANAAHFFLDAIEVTIQQDKMQFGTAREDAWPILCDLFASTLIACDPTPIRAVGLNTSVHFQTGSEKAWHNAGHRMAPKEFWNEIWPHKAGMRSIQMQLERDAPQPRSSTGLKDAGHINVVMQPSNVVDYGVYVNINDHFLFEKLRAGTVSKLIAEQYKASMSRTKSILEAIVKEAKHG